MEYFTKIIGIEQLTPDVKKFILEKPKEYSFEPGQSTYLSINQEGLEFEKRPFTFCNLNEDENLEILVKVYKEREGVTAEMDKLNVNDELIISDPFGSINYWKEGYFIAGGVGVTPYISMLKDLKNKGKLGNNKLIFSNKTKEDIILEQELKEIFSEKPENLIFTLTREENKDYKNGRVDENFLKEFVDDFSKEFYICGTHRFMAELNLLIQKIRKEKEI